MPSPDPAPALPRQLAFASLFGAAATLLSFAASLPIAGAVTGSATLASALCTSFLYARALEAQARTSEAASDAPPGLSPEAFLETLRPRCEEGAALCVVRVLNLDSADAALSRDERASLIATQARRLKVLCGGPVGRLREDTLAFAVPGDASLRAILDDASAIVTALSRPVLLADGAFVPRAAAGIARAPEDARDAEALLDHALSALGAGMKRGTGRVHLYERGARAALRHALDLEHSLQRAVHDKRLELVYQPIVDAVAGRTIAAEALVRFRHPELGPIPPSTFIPIAERAGFVADIDRFVLEEAGRRVTAWRSALHLPELFVSVNLSTQQFRDPHLPGFIGGVLHDAGVDPSAIVLEITETAALHDLEQSCQSVRQLRTLGVKIALDDFGTGHSWLTHLSHLALDRIKIDQAFVRDLHDNPRHERICQTMVELAQDLSLTVVAEGVERLEHARTLSAMGVQQLQGFFFAGPLTAERFAAYASLHTGESSGTRFVGARRTIRKAHGHRRQDIC